MITFEIVDEDAPIPDWLTQSVKSNRIQVETVIGWIDLEEPSFTVGNTYREKPYEVD